MKKYRQTRYDEEYVIGWDNANKKPVTWVFLPPHGIIFSEKETKADMFVNSIVQQALDNNHTKVFGVDLDQKNMSHLSTDQNKDMLEVATTIEESEVLTNRICEVISSRIKELAKLGLNVYADLEDDYDVVLLIVNNSQKLWKGNGKIVQEKMDFIAKFGKTASVFLLFNNYDHKRSLAISGETYANLGLRIQIGKVEESIIIHENEERDEEREEKPRSFIVWRKNKHSPISDQNSACDVLSNENGMVVNKFYKSELCYLVGTQD